MRERERAQYLGRDGRRLITLDQPDSHQLVCSLYHARRFNSLTSLS